MADRVAVPGVAAVARVRPRGQAERKGDAEPIGEGEQISEAEPRAMEQAGVDGRAPDAGRNCEDRATGPRPA